MGLNHGILSLEEIKEEARGSNTNRGICSTDVLAIDAINQFYRLATAS